MVIQFTPLEAPTLDPRTEAELVERALDVVYSASSGKLNDFSPSSPARALIEGQCFAQAEFLYYLNQLPEGMAIAFLQIAGIQRRLGTAAQVTLTFTLTAPLASSFTIPQGTQVKVASGSIMFATDAVLTIPAGAIAGEVTATATTVGSGGNVGAFAITVLTQPLAFLQGVTNTAAATGGTDEETLDQVKTRAFAAIRRRGLVSANDYQEETIALLGIGGVAVVRGNLQADGISFQKGCVHVFCLNGDASLLSAAQLESVQASLQTKTHVSVAVYVSNVDVVDLDIYVIASLVPGTNPQAIADDINTALQDYLKPGQLAAGETIILKELEFLVRGAGVDYVQSVTMGETTTTRLGTNFPLPYSYSVAKLSSLGVELVDGTNTYTFAYGYGDPD